jgi:hypothetical protein
VEACWPLRAPAFAACFSNSALSARGVVDEPGVPSPSWEISRLPETAHHPRFIAIRPAKQTPVISLSSSIEIPYPLAKTSAPELQVCFSDPLRSLYCRRTPGSKVQSFPMSEASTLATRSPLEGNAKRVGKVRPRCSSVRGRRSCSILSQARVCRAANRRRSAGMGTSRTTAVPLARFHNNTKMAPAVRILGWRQDL